MYHCLEPADELCSLHIQQLHVGARRPASGLTSASQSCTARGAPVHIACKSSGLWIVAATARLYQATLLLQVLSTGHPCMRIWTGAPLAVLCMGSTLGSDLVTPIWRERRPYLFCH